MSVNVRTTSRDGAKTTSVIRSQRSSCVVQIFSYKDEDITKLNFLNVATEKSLTGISKSSTGNLKEKGPLVIRNDVIKCSISKNKGNPGGQFQIVLKKGKSFSGTKTGQNNVDYMHLVHPGDWITIYLKKDGDISDKDLASTKVDSGFKFLGIVENIRMDETDNPNTGVPSLEYTITGSEFGKALEMSVFFNPQVNGKTMETLLGAKFLTDSKNPVKAIGGNTPDVVIKKLVDFFIGGQGTKVSGANDNWYVPRAVANLFKAKTNPKDRNKQPKPFGSSFKDILSLSNVGLPTYRNGVLQNMKALPGACLIKAIPSSGTLWSFLDFFKNSALNEMYTELIPDKDNHLKPSLVLRQIPFSSKPKDETNIITAHKRFVPKDKETKDTTVNQPKTYYADLPKRDLISSDIKSKNIGKSDHDRINYVMVVPKIDSATFDLLYTTGSNTPSIQRYGLKTYQTQTSYVLGSSSKDAQSLGIKEYCEMCVRHIMDWFFMSHNFYNGTLVVDGSDKHTPVGTNLYIKDSQQLFHIEGYTHNYQISVDGNTYYTTEYRVSRGVRMIGGRIEFMGSSSKHQDSANKIYNDPTTVAIGFIDSPRRGIRA